MCECRIRMKMEKGWKMKENVGTKANKKIREEKVNGGVMVG